MVNDANRNGDSKFKPEDVEEAAKLLRNSEGPNLHEGIIESNRIFYFKGQRFLSALAKARRTKDVVEKNTDQKWDKDTQKALFQRLLEDGKISRIEKLEEKSRKFRPISDGNKAIEYDDAGYYMWMMEASSTHLLFYGGLVVVGLVLAMTFPAWPNEWKIAVSQIAQYFLIFLLGLLAVRYVIAYISWAFVGRTFWLLPNIFDDYAKSYFRPVYSVEKSERSMVKALLVTVGIGLGAFLLYFLFTLEVKSATWILKNPNGDGGEETLDEDGVPLHVEM
eukprot:CAMPEP_0113885870 /NCGR_PEP_ID=MMETSP0780_2-20120614/11189_1 /TAXON_ID=652834 /ORGANISM="Palpitomonas bilix" /LENGTH=277 /DNA_ID=CAMNT_0000873921 /DNA_START=171 /DNA_END=1007 /DNA_ORIENTATION=- /assembly_acc=CAM_ASM_000599